MIKKILSTPGLYAIRALGRILPDTVAADALYLKLLFKYRTGKNLNLNNPQTFNEKLQWLKLYDRKPEYTTMVDKYEVKKYVADKIGEEYIIPTLGIWDKFEDIDFNALPDKFVLKCTHDSGGLIICKDKSNLDVEYVKQKINRCLSRNYYYNSREWPYKNVKPRIIAERYMEEVSSESLNDYKFFCFNGIPKMVLVCSERYSKEGICEDFYDTEWNRLVLKRPGVRNNPDLIHKPSKLEEMMELSKVLSENSSFSRIDFYEINNKVYFGEITFFPASGMKGFEPVEWDYKLGNLIKIK